MSAGRPPTPRRVDVARWRRLPGSRLGRPAPPPIYHPPTGEEPLDAPDAPIDQISAVASGVGSTLAIAYAFLAGTADLGFIVAGGLFTLFFLAGLSNDPAWAPAAAGGAALTLGSLVSVAANFGYALGPLRVSPDGDHRLARSVVAGALLQGFGLAGVFLGVVAHCVADCGSGTPFISLLAPVVAVSSLSKAAPGFYHFAADLIAPPRSDGRPGCRRAR